VVVDELGSGEIEHPLGLTQHTQAHVLFSFFLPQDEKSRWKISTHSDVYRRRMLLTRTDKFDDHQVRVRVREEGSIG
jgi:hypothetical protein